MTKLSGNDALMKVLRLIGIPHVSGPNDPHFVKWKHDCLRALSQIDGDQSPTLRAFEEIDFKGDSLGTVLDESYSREYFSERLTEAVAILQSMREAIQDEINMALQNTAGISNQTAQTTSSPPSRKVFVVHGHNEQLKGEVARFLEQLKLQPIILHEQADRGQTIIEKFEKHSDVAFALILLTPDDVGGHDNHTLRQRARQNVIFEFGYFLGKLGRSKVCGLYYDGVELPSDYAGVLYTKVNGGWHLNVVRELKAAGFSIDANLLA